MKKIIQLLEKYQEIVAYFFWGVMTTMVSWGTYSLFTIIFEDYVEEVQLFQMEISIVVLISNILSWISAVIFAFITNKLWVFESRSWEMNVWLPEFCKFLSARICTGIMEIAAVPLLVGLGLNQTILGIEGMVAKIVVSVAVVVLNYIFSKLFIFK